MPVSQDDAQGEETVVRHPDGKITKGWMRWTTDGPVITLDDGTKVHNEEGYWYRVYHNIVVDNLGNREVLKLTNPLMVSLKPLLHFERPYASDLAQTDIKIYPPSSNGWYERMVLGEDKAIYSVQLIDTKKLYWLTIFKDDGSILESHTIRFYEYETLTLKDDIYEYHRLLGLLDSLYTSNDRSDFFKILDGPPPALKDLVSAIGRTPGIVPQLGKTMLETFELSRILPRNMDSITREEIMLFLAWMITDDLPIDDPVDMFDRHLLVVPAARFLLQNYLVRKAKSLESLPYIKIINKSLSQPGKIYERDDLLRQLLVTLPVDEIDSVVVDAVTSLNESKKIVAALPISRADAKSDPVLWRKRLLLYWGGIRFQVLPSLETLGLRELIYIGAAHQWPHRHMSWSGLLDDSQSNSRFNSMIMPPEAVERVKRTRPNVMEVDSYTRSDNLNLYDFTTNSWRIPLGRIRQAVRGNRTFSSYAKEFGIERVNAVVPIEQEEARIIDYLHSPGIYLPMFESGQIKTWWNIENDVFTGILKKLTKSQVIRLFYSISATRFRGLLSILRGEPSRVLSITRGLLRYTPLASARTINRGESAIIMIRLPEYTIPAVVDILNSIEDDNLLMRCSRLVGLRSYHTNLFQRLLRGPNDWDDDIDGFISQMRS